MKYKDYFNPEYLENWQQIYEVYNDVKEPFWAVFYNYDTVVLDGGAENQKTLKDHLSVPLYLKRREYLNNFCKRHLFDCEKNTSKVITKPTDSTWYNVILPKFLSCLTQTYALEYEYNRIRDLEEKQTKQANEQEFLFNYVAISKRLDRSATIKSQNVVGNYSTQDYLRFMLNHFPFKFMGNIEECYNFFKQVNPQLFEEVLSNLNDNETGIEFI